MICQPGSRDPIRHARTPGPSTLYFDPGTTRLARSSDLHSRVHLTKALATYYTGTLWSLPMSPYVGSDMYSANFTLAPAQFPSPGPHGVVCSTFGERT